MDRQARGNPEEQTSDAPLVSRRSVLAAAGGMLAGGAFGLLAGKSASRTGVPADVVVGPAADLLDTIRSNGPEIRDFGSVPVAIVSWDPSLPGAREAYGQDHAVLDARGGLMALVLRDPHLGCRVQWCASSGWFENPCHGEHYNAWGEWMAGPAPRGLDRYASHVDAGRYVIGFGHFRVGPDRDHRVGPTGTSGPHCVGT